MLLVKTLLQKKGSVSLDKNMYNKNILHMMAELCTKGDMSSILRDVIEQVLNKVWHLKIISYLGFLFCFLICIE